MDKYSLMRNFTDVQHHFEMFMLNIEAQRGITQKQHIGKILDMGKNNGPIQFEYISKKCRTFMLFCNLGLSYLDY